MSKVNENEQHVNEQPLPYEYLKQIMKSESDMNDSVAAVPITR